MTCFVQVLKLLYDSDVVEEAAVLAWAEEKKLAEAQERVFLEKSGEFIKWLREAEEEDDDDEDEDESDDES